MQRLGIASLCWTVLVVACATSGGSGDSETHFLECTTDLDCPGHQRCEARRCTVSPDAGAGGTSGRADSGNHLPSSGGSASGADASDAGAHPADATVSTDARAHDASTEASPNTGGDGGAGEAGSIDAAPPASCERGGDGLTNCGASSESCCTSHVVPGGTYYRTYDVATDGGVRPGADGGLAGAADPATVSDFRLDEYLVTVGRFRAFVAAWNGGAGYTPPPGSGKHTHLNGGQGLRNSWSGVAYETGWLAANDVDVAPTDANLACSGAGSTWTSAAAGQETLPINCVSWFEAYAFCIWDGGFLPSEAEWEYAAAGGSEQREYPWGATAPGTQSQYAIYGCYYPSGSGTCTSVINIAPVGTPTAGAGRWGQLDLAGEMLEWNLDYASGPYVTPCTDCASLTETNGRVLRGGNFGSSLYLHPPDRYTGTPTLHRGGFGFRCARTP